jgi:hypothetical protein
VPIATPKPRPAAPAATAPPAIDDGVQEFGVEPQVRP